MWPQRLILFLSIVNNISGGGTKNVKHHERKPFLCSSSIQWLTFYFSFQQQEFDKGTAYSGAIAQPGRRVGTGVSRFFGGVLHATPASGSVDDVTRGEQRWFTLDNVHVVYAAHADTFRNIKSVSVITSVGPRCLRNGHSDLFQAPPSHHPFRPRHKQPTPWYDRSPMTRSTSYIALLGCFHPFENLSTLSSTNYARLSTSSSHVSVRIEKSAFCDGSQLIHGILIHHDGR